MVAKDLGFFMPMTVNGIPLRRANETTVPAFLADIPRLYQVFGYYFSLSRKPSETSMLILSSRELGAKHIEDVPPWPQ